MVGMEWDHQHREAGAGTASAALLSQQRFKNSFGRSIINPLLLLRAGFQDERFGAGSVGELWLQPLQEQVHQEGHKGCSALLSGSPTSKVPAELCLCCEIPSGCGFCCFRRANPPLLQLGVLAEKSLMGSVLCYRKWLKGTSEITLHLWEWHGRTFFLSASQF